MSTLLGCPIDETLADETMTLVTDIRAAEGDLDDKRRITEVLSRLTEASLDYYFTRPAKELGAGRTIMGIITVGNRGALKLIRRGLGQVLARFDRAQILQVADYIEECFYEI